MNIVKKIEALRRELVEQGEKKGLQDPLVIKLSQNLDILINAYYRHEKNNKLDVRATG